MLKLWVVLTEVGKVLPLPTHQAGHPTDHIRVVHHYYLLRGTCREINEKKHRGGHQFSGRCRGRL